jgi:hypothetical protein
VKVSQAVTNTFGNQNVAAGSDALHRNKRGGANVAVGSQALFSNATGSSNVAAGFGALFANTTGWGNVATGNYALRANTNGDSNVAIGPLALSRNTTGRYNVAIGRGAGDALTTGSHNIYIANSGGWNEAGTIRIGTTAGQTATYIAGISGTPLSGATQPVVVRPNGQLGVAPASSMSTESLAATVDRLTNQLKRQQRQIERLREHVRGG